MNQATIQVIDKIISIEGANSIELAIVLGWQCVAEKGKFKEGDKAIYVQIDTLLPYHPKYAFLEKSSAFKEYGVEYERAVTGVKYTRLKTAKFLGNISQGLLLSVDDYNLSNTDIGADVSGDIGAVKYTKPLHVSMAGSAKGTFPSFIIKTDEERIQNISSVLSQFDGKTVYESLKIDGTSCTYYYLLENDKFGICSRNMEMLEDGGSIYALMAKRENIKDKLKSFCIDKGHSIAIQGEISGPSIQGNKLRFPAQQFHIFTMQKISEKDIPTYMSKKDILDFSEYSGILSVPILDEHIFHADIHTKDFFLDKVSKINFMGTECVEGIVVRLSDENNAEQPPRGLNRWSFKVINNNYKD